MNIQNKNPIQQQNKNIDKQLSNMINSEPTKQSLHPASVKNDEKKPAPLKDCTQFSSQQNPLRYTDGRLIKKGDLVLHIRTYEGRGVRAQFSQVWQTLYFDNGEPIGVALNSVNSKKSPTIESFTVTDNSGQQKRYFKTLVTIPQDEIADRLLPLTMPNEQVSPVDADEAFFYQRVEQLSEQGKGIALFALALWFEQVQEWSLSINAMVRASKCGYIPANCHLYWLYSIGRGCDRNYQMARQYLEKGANAGDALAQYELATLYVEGGENYHIKADKDKALAWLEKASQQRLRNADFILGLCYKHGDFNASSNNPDYHTDNKEYAKKAYHYFEALAKQEWSGQYLALYELANCYRLGIHVPKNSTQAVELYKKVVEIGDSDSAPHNNACYYVAIATIKKAQAIKKSLDKQLLNEASPNKSLDKIKAQQALANEDIKYGIDCLSDLAENHYHIPARFFMANAYLKGEWIEKNEQQAKTYLQSISKKREYPDLAKKASAMLIQLSDGIYQKAQHAQQNSAEYDTKALHQLAIDLSLQFPNLEKAQQLAFSLYQETAKRGWADGILQVASCYHHGRGVAQDSKTALQWYRQALQAHVEQSLSAMTIADIRENIRQCEMANRPKRDDSFDADQAYQQILQTHNLSPSGNSTQQSLNKMRNTFLIVFFVMVALVFIWVTFKTKHL
ncbi:tetratricopeptide repeat protein [Psychrobacter sp. I-STPA6b]|uniref:tetratricopeptide repeat protein n=1 Tax=Psychrobacter sp. I-STPA6b TaxID=2585718 RepID=UPI001D0C6116|nr:tetratricopeptide repeat protein [Psychrobacter sp. I-STPA6b]